MTTVKCGTKVLARLRLLACGLTLLAGCSQEPLTAADPHADLPVPKRSSHAGSFISKSINGVEAPLRLELKTTVRADISDVLAFYRVELGKRSWREKPDDTVVAADHAQLAFVSPKGPATLRLGVKDETTIDLVQRNTEAAAKANVLPTSGQARLIFGYLRPDVASLVINDQTIEIAGGINHPQMLDLPPGTYPFELRVSGRLLRTDTITVAAGEAWSLTFDDDRKSDQIY
ncbi:hypothetical protein [uncultured Bradyrhizobium sp.]|jgi:hypothetical protein|uniref:hypothetical protein n=1 Tax=uncultured Bradyrhizobium sp. TaxID=199684 RepID=UPI0026307853|nr:hypothetical protein [uncultured Bradyrhizobium sp.]